MSMKDPALLLSRLLAQPHETECVEWKENDSHPDGIGEYLSALANSAALHGKEAGYIIWGVQDATREIVGTNFEPRSAKIGNQELENWLTTLLTPSTSFCIYEFTYNNKPIVLIEVSPASSIPVRFKGTEFIRVGTYKKKLKDHPDKERDLWALFARASFEGGISQSHVSAADVLSLLDYSSYFDVTKQSHPEDRVRILARLASEKLVNAHEDDTYDITNLGAILFARDLNTFDRLSRKALRVIVYRGHNRAETIREQVGVRGYAAGYEGAISFINSQLPQNEQIGPALREEVRMYPEIAIRELVANAIIHQDFNMTGTGPIVEIFVDRIEITNPGKPLVDTMRILDLPPQSRNETLAAFMRRINICEERGSGIDKVIIQVELFQLPPPDFTVEGDHMKAVLFSYKKLAEMDKLERIRACYQHACLCWVSRQTTTNATLRKRFAIPDTAYPTASRIIAETLDAELIKPYDPENKSKKHSRYVPFWG